MTFENPSDSTYHVVLEFLDSEGDPNNPIVVDSIAAEIPPGQSHQVDLHISDVVLLKSCVYSWCRG